MLYGAPPGLKPSKRFLFGHQARQWFLLLLAVHAEKANAAKQWCSVQYMTVKAQWQESIFEGRKMKKVYFDSPKLFHLPTLGSLKKGLPMIMHDISICPLIVPCLTQLDPAGSSGDAHT